MGFWDSALKLGKEAINEAIDEVKKDPLKVAKKIGAAVVNEAINEVKKAPEEMKKAKEKYASYSDERLLDIIRDNSTFLKASISEKMAASSVLRDRGYDAETIKMLNSQE